MMMCNGSFIVLGIYFLVGDACLCLYPFTQCADFESEVNAALNASVCLSQCLVYALGFVFVTDDYAVGKPASECSQSLALIPTCVLSHTILIRAQCRNYQQGFSFVHL